MKKRFKRVILIIFFFATSILLGSCSKNNGQFDNVQNSNGNANINNKIQLWYYIYSKGDYEREIKTIVDRAKQFCEENDIELEIFGYDKDTISKEDYMLKRNISIVSGNAIIIDSIDNLYEIAKHHADYTKIDNYHNLLNAYKDRFFIPLGAVYDATSLENEVIRYYDISIDNKWMTYTDYLELKQTMKEKGAKFELNYREFNQLIDYYMYKNNFLFFNEDDEKFSDINAFKRTLKDIVISVCNDIVVYNDADLKISVENRDIFDKTSNMVFDIDFFNNVGNIFSPGAFSSMVTSSEHGKYQTNIGDKSLYINPHISYDSPNLYLYKKITNERIFDLVNYIANEETYVMIQTIESGSRKEFFCRYAPVFKLDKAKEALELNEDLEFIDDFWNLKTREYINNSYEAIVKNEDKSKEVADAYYSNTTYSRGIRNFIRSLSEDIAKNLSGESMSLEKFNLEDKQINDLIDKEIDRFVTNWKIYN